MFQSIAQSFHNIVQRWTKKSLTDKEIALVLQEIRLALIDADTSVDACDAFIADLKNRYPESITHQQINGKQHLQAWIHGTLVETLGRAPTHPIHITTTPHIIFMVGLQGAGKTTTTIKLASWIEKNLAKKVAVTSVDFQRPAAQEQLNILADNHNIIYIPSPQINPDQLKDHLVKQTVSRHADVLIVDTAGRLSIDDALMQALHTLQKTFRPGDIFYVVDSQMGQNAATTAKQFHDKLSFTSSILTKCDADSKGGVALSLKTVTQKPISFIGEGEKVEHLTLFNPERIANRMLDLGDVASLVEKMKKNIDADEAKRQSTKLSQGQFDLEDFLTQTKQLQSMGGMKGIMSMLPGAQSMPEHLKNMIDENTTKGIVALIQSMTRKERRHPALLNQTSRKERILKGSGRSKKELTDTLKQYEKMKTMIQKMSPSKMRMMMEMFAKNQKNS